MTSTKKKIKSPPSTVAFNVVGTIIVCVLAICCLIPFWLVISGSFSNESDIIKFGYALWPKHFSVAAYQSLFVFKKALFQAYGVTLFVTIVGTGAGLFLTTMTGYVLSRKEFRYRNQVSFFIYFTTLFSGGLIPWYMVVAEGLHLKDSLGALILPALTGVFNIILMKTFLKSVPDSVVESARIDGAGDFRIFIELVLPIAKPALATIGLFLALGYWNDWFSSSIFITTPSKFALQFVLFKTLSMAEFLKTSAAANVPTTYVMPTETIKLATAIVATGPVIFFYPFVQKYFVAGLTIGAVKG